MAYCVQLLLLCFALNSGFGSCEQDACHPYKNLATCFTHLAYQKKVDILHIEDVKEKILDRLRMGEAPPVVHMAHHEAVAAMMTLVPDNDEAGVRERVKQNLAVIKPSIGECLHLTSHSL